MAEAADRRRRRRPSPTSYCNDIFSIPTLRALRSHSGPNPPDRYVIDQTGRLQSTDDKTGVDCPAQTDRPSVLLLIGQSNAGNHAGQRYRLRYAGNLAIFIDGRCFVAESPLLGSEGIAG